MTREIKAGVVVVQKFCSAKSDIFSSYIEYIDRAEAVRIKNEHKFNLFSNYVGSYMDDHEKTTGLFTKEKDQLTVEEKKCLKKGFQKAQDRNSLMWQTVISFDNRWLEEMGLYQDGVLDQLKIKEYTRNAMGRMAKSESLEQALWTGCIHYNTDNIHIHIAMVETIPTREKMIYQGEEVYRGKFKQKSLDTCKSSIVNQIIQEKGHNEEINRIMREQIVSSKKRNPFLEDPDLSKKFLALYQKLPENKSVCNYGNPAMKCLRTEIDELSNEYLKKYHAEEFKRLKSLICKQDKMYQTAYGESQQGYGTGKMDDLYKRLGNAILKELKNYDERIGNVTYDTFQKRGRKSMCDRRGITLEQTKEQIQKRATYELEKSIRYLRRSMYIDYETWKNIQEHDYEMEHSLERE